MVKTGIGHSIGFGEESTYGTGVTPDYFLDARAGAETLTAEIDTFRPESLTGRALDPAQFVEGQSRVSGSITHDLRYGGGWGMFLAHLGASAWASSGSGYYTHQTLIGGAVVSAALGKGISVTTDREGALGSGTAKAVRFSGIRPKSVDFDFQLNGIATATWECFGTEAALVAQPTATLSTVDYVTSPSAQGSAATATVAFGTDGSETDYANVQSVNLHIEQPLDERYDLSNNVSNGPVPSGYTIVTGSFELDAQDVEGTSFGAFGDAYRTKTATNSLIITVEGADVTSGNPYALIFNMPAVEITSPADQHVGDAGVQRITVEFQAHYSTIAGGAGLPGVCKVILKNGEVGVY
jgi:hypothetical protein